MIADSVAGDVPALPARYRSPQLVSESRASLVYRVTDPVTGRDLALKVLGREAPDAQELLRFRSEFATLASLDHPNIVKVFDYSVLPDGRPYFTMEFVEGPPVSEFFDGSDWAALYDVTIAVASALLHVHRRGYLHLDVKPSNIIVGPGRRPVLMDFGLAIDSSRVLDPQIRGTLQYIAPEVLQQDRVDSRADLYALGMTLYETVTGTVPARGKEPIEVIRMHLDGTLRKPSLINAHIPPALEHIILKLLERDPRHRYSSTAALLQALSEASGRSTSADLLLGGGELLAAPLIGREAEVEAILALIRGARTSNGGGIVLTGGEGVGKSRIVREAAFRAQLEGARVVWGRCPVNRKTIYAPFFEIFRQLVLAANPDADAAEEVRRILRPATASAGVDSRSPVRGQKYRFFNRFFQSVQDLFGFLRAGEENSAWPLVLVVEDLQWADRSTIELFSFLIGEAKKNMLVVIGTLVADGGTPGAGMLAQWEQRSSEIGFPLIRVQPLTEALVREHVASLLGQSELDDDFVRWVFWESGGSPLAIRRIFEYLIAHDYLQWSRGSWVVDLPHLRTLRIPGGTAAIVLERADALGGEQRQVLELAAVIGKDADVALLTSLCSLAPEKTFDVLRELIELELLTESSSGAAVVFPQISVRDAIYGAMPERRRSELHLRVAEALEAAMLAGSPQLLGQVAYHFSRANDTERGLRYAVEAGDVAIRALANAEAIEFYRIALELMEIGSTDDLRRSEVREKLGDAYYRSSDLAAAMQTFQFLLRSTQVRDDESGGATRTAARLMTKIGKVLGKRGEHDAALSYLQRALQAYEAVGDTVEVAELLNRIAGLHREKDDFESARVNAERALALLDGGETGAVFGYVKNMLGVIEYAVGNWERSKSMLLEAYAVGERVGSDQLRKIASTNLGNTLWKLGDWATALRYYRMNLEMSEAEGDLWNLVTAYNNVGIIEFGRGDFPGACGHFERSGRVAQKIGAIEYEALAEENLGEALEMLGRWPDALVHYQRCLSMPGFDESRPSRVSVYVPLARLLSRKGDVARAIDLAQKALAAGERARDEDLVAEAAYALAVIEEDGENLDEAERQLARALSIFDANHTVPGLARAHTAAAALALRRGKSEEAEGHARLGESYAREIDDRFNCAKNEWVWGKIHYFRDQREAAFQKLERARAMFEEIDTPYELARVLFDTGTMHDDAQEAIASITAAIRIFERLDAKHDLERARGALSRTRPAGRLPAQNVGLYEVVKIINSTLDLAELLNRVVDLAIRRLRAERGMILLLDPITGALRTRVARNISDADDGSKRSPQSIVREVIRSGLPIMSADARADERFADSQSVIAENIISMLCVPLVIRERIAGAIYVDHREVKNLFTEKDRNFMEAFADQAAIAIENARLYEELEEARARLSLENESLRRDVLVEKHLDSIIGTSQVVRDIQFAVRRAAAANSTVFLRGESGTGKGLIARVIHNMGPRRSGPFINFNCAALPETLAESELFGHEKGAFTGADRRKLGRFELANGGTIFLDEIGKMSMAMQAKLLRVVEEKEFERVGGTQTIRTDVKVIAAGNIDTARAIEAGTFREDLFYRLNIVPIVLPPLRSRKDDIPMLTEHFIRKICRDLGIEIRRLAPGVLDLFFAYDWPGNIRELEATLHRAIVMSTSETLTSDDFHALVGDRANGGRATGAPAVAAPADLTPEAYEETLASVDRQLIRRALEQSGGRIREAARRLGLARNTLKSKMQKYGIAGKE